MEAAIKTERLATSGGLSDWVKGTVVNSEAQRMSAMVAKMEDQAKNQAPSGVKEI